MSKIFIKCRYVVVGILVFTSALLVLLFVLMRSFFIDGYYACVASQLVVDVSVLENLRNGEVESAISILEMRIDVGVDVAESGYGVVSAGVDEMLDDAMRGAKKYKRIWSSE